MENEYKISMDLGSAKGDSDVRTIFKTENGVTKILLILIDPKPIPTEL